MFRTLLLLVVAALLFCSCSRQQKATGTLRHDAYVWQRSWNEQVIDAVSQRRTNFTALIVLQAEVTWRSGRPVTTRVPLDFDTLRASGCQVGLAMRIGAFGGPFVADDERGRFLAQLAQSLL